MCQHSGRSTLSPWDLGTESLVQGQHRWKPKDPVADCFLVPVSWGLHVGPVEQTWSSYLFSQVCQHPWETISLPVCSGHRELLHRISSGRVQKPEGSRLVFLFSVFHVGYVSTVMCSLCRWIPPLHAARWVLETKPSSGSLQKHSVLLTSQSSIATVSFKTYNEACDVTHL